MANELDQNMRQAAAVAKSLMEKMAETDLGELELEMEEPKLKLRLKAKKPLPPKPPEMPPMGGVMPQPVAVAPVAATPAAAAPAAVETEAPAEEKEPEPKGKLVTAPLVGTFYAAPSPEQAPFVKVGDVVAEGDVVCIIESMKLMNEVQSEHSGKVLEILVENGQGVEYGQPLIRIE